MKEKKQEEKENEKEKETEKEQEKHKHKEQRKDRIGQGGGHQDIGLARGRGAQNRLWHEMGE